MVNRLLSNSTNSVEWFGQVMLEEKITGKNNRREL
jgi:hypothetical protein